MQAILVPSTEPALNLALEECLFNSLMPNNQGYFLLWHNAPSIIVGRHQNTLAEVNGELVSRYKLPVIRRMTGGGAVYHDLGNLNYSFIRPLYPHEKGKIDFATFLMPMVKALHSLGLQAHFTSRNDITCGDKKISGSAQLRRQGKILHHGTLLVNLDLDMLGTVLTGAPDKYLSKGVNSIRSRVANVKEFMSINTQKDSSCYMDIIKQALIQTCATEIIDLDNNIWQEVENLANAKYRAYNWNYGASPAFTHEKRERFPWGLVQCHFDVHKGQVRQCKIFGDFFANSPIEALEKSLQGIDYSEVALSTAVQDINWQDYFANCDSIKMQKFFCNI